MSAQKAFSNWSSFVVMKNKRAIALKNAITLSVSEAGMVYENTAKSEAQYDLGYHKQNIGFRPLNWHSITMFANADYAPFLEFGTGGLVDIPAGWESVAIAFKGKGVKKINLPARPHIIPAWYKAKAFLEKQMVEAVKRTQ